MILQKFSGKPVPRAEMSAEDAAKWERISQYAQRVKEYWLTKVGTYEETDNGLPEGGANGHAIGGTFTEINERRARNMVERMETLGALCGSGSLDDGQTGEIFAAYRRLPANWKLKESQ